MNASTFTLVVVSAVNIIVVWFVILALYMQIKDEHASKPVSKPVANHFTDSLEGEALAQAIAFRILNEGTQATTNGSIIFHFYEIDPWFNTNLAEDSELVNNIVWELEGTPFVLDIEVSDDDFDIIFGTAYCPNYEEEDIAI